MSTLPSMFERMDDDAILGNFLGLPENENMPDIIIASIPYELTTSYGQGTEKGPAACIEACRFMPSSTLEYFINSL